MFLVPLTLFFICCVSSCIFMFFYAFNDFFCFMYDISVLCVGYSIPWYQVLWFVSIIYTFYVSYFHVLCLLPSCYVSVTMFCDSYYYGSCQLLLCFASGTVRVRVESVTVLLCVSYFFVSCQLFLCFVSITFIGC